MEHAYKFQDSFPHQNARGQYVPYFQATPEVFPSQMMFDPTKVPVFHGTVPYGPNYSYPCHSCYNNMHFHNHYGYRPSCPHSFPPQPLPCWGSYSAHPQFFPAHEPPPPAYAAEIPRYEYAKHVAEPGNHHCCGCSNHVCKPKGERSIKIEGQEPSLQKEKPSAEGTVQYPIIWIPPEYVKEKEHKIPLELKSIESDGTSQYIKPRGRSLQQQPSRKSFLPVRLEDLGLQTLDGEDHRKGTQQLEDNRKLLSYPIVWIPYAGQQSAEKEEKETSPKSSYQGSSDSHGDSAKNDTANGITGEPWAEGNIGCKNELNMPGEHEDKKHIPVKDVNQEDCGKGTSDVSSEEVEDKVKGPSGTKELVSPKEKKKLPPVCLRVDPLPKRKNSNGSSRSSSPPGARENAFSGVKDNNGTNPPSEVAEEKRSHKEKRKEVKVIEVKDSPTGKKDGEMVCKQPIELPVISNSLGQEKQIGREENGKRTVTEENVVDHGQMEERKKTEERNLSETEAAILLQAAYRGFEVRKLETRKKLKQMAKIREEVATIKKNIQALESSLSASLDQEKVTKQRIVIGESIMSLLLSLDTIQGLHSSLRDVRKSLARELVSLQEWLDSLVNKRSDELIENQSSASSEEDRHEAPADDTNKQHEEMGEADAQSEAISSHYESSAVPKAVESPEVQPLDEEELLSTPLEVKSPDQMVVDQTNQASVSSDASCQVVEVKPNESVEQVCEQLEKSLENRDSENKEKEADDPSSDGAVNAGATGKLSGSADSDEQLSHHQRGETELPGELPTGVLAGPEQIMFEIHEKKDVAYEDHQQQITLEEDTESGKHETVTDEPRRLLNEEGSPQKEDNMLNEEGSPQKEDNIGGDKVVLAMVSEEALPSSETTMPEQIEGGSPYSIDGQVEEHPQEEASNVCEVLPVTSPDGEPSALEFETIAGPGQLMDNSASSKLSNKEADDVHEPEMPSPEGKRENSIITEAPEDGITEDKPALDEVVIPAGESKLSDRKQDDENDSNERLLEENEKLRQMMQKLMEAGKEQLDVISSLTGRVKDLEKKLAKKKKMRLRRCKTAAAARPLCLNQTSNSPRQTPQDVSA